MKISIITVCYNCAEVVEKTILSVVGQTYKDIEYIIVDGGSNDGTVDIINKYNTRLAYYISEHDNGIYDAMNKGLKVASGEWVNFMNAGDCFYDSDVVQKFVDKVQNIHQCVLAYGRTIDFNGSKQYEHKCSPLSTISFKTPFCHQSVFVKNLGSEIQFSNKYHIVADYDLFYKLYYKYGKSYFYALNFFVAKYDISGGLSKNVALKHEQQRERLNIRSQHKDFRWYYDLFKYIIKIVFLGASL